MQNILLVLDVIPRTKKNHSQIITNGGRRILLPSKQYLEFEKACKPFLKPFEINEPVNLCCYFYMPTKRKVDLPNLLNAICDVFVKHKVVVDDNSTIVASFNGSKVLYDKERPRIVVEITPYKDSQAIEDLKDKCEDLEYENDILRQRIDDLEHELSEKRREEERRWRLL